MIFVPSRWGTQTLGDLGCSTSLFIHPWSLWDENKSHCSFIHCCNVGSKQLAVLLNIFYNCKKCEILWNKMTKTVNNLSKWPVHHVINGANLDFGEHVTQVACIDLCSSRCRCGTFSLYPWQWRKTHPLVIQPSALRVGQQHEELFWIWTWEGEKSHLLVVWSNM